MKKREILLNALISLGHELRPTHAAGRTISRSDRHHGYEPALLCLICTQDANTRPWCPLFRPHSRMRPPALDAEQAAIIRIDKNPHRLRQIERDLRKNRLA
jgi:hypothetical protein